MGAMQMGKVKVSFEVDGERIEFEAVRIECRAFCRELDYHGQSYQRSRPEYNVTIHCHDVGWYVESIERENAELRQQVHAVAKSFEKRLATQTDELRALRAQIPGPSWIEEYGKKWARTANVPYDVFDDGSKVPWTSTTERQHPLTPDELRRYRGTVHITETGQRATFMSGTGVVYRETPCDRCRAHRVNRDTAVCLDCGWDHVTGGYTK